MKFKHILPIVATLTLTTVSEAQETNKESACQIFRNPNLESRGLFNQTRLRHNQSTEFSQFLADDLAYLTTLHRTITTNREELPRDVLNALEKSLNEELGYDYSVPEFILEKARRDTTYTETSTESETQQRSSTPKSTSSQEIEKQPLSFWEVSAQLYGDRSIGSMYHVGRWAIGAGLFNPRENSANDSTLLDTKISEPRPGFRAVRTWTEDSITEEYPIGGRIKFGVNLSDKLSAGLLANITREETACAVTDSTVRYINDSQIDAGGLTSPEKTSYKTKLHPGMWAKASDLYKGFGLATDVYNTREGIQGSVGITKRFGGSRNKR